MKINKNKMAFAIILTRGQYCRTKLWINLQGNQNTLDIAQQINEEEKSNF